MRRMTRMVSSFKAGVMGLAALATILGTAGAGTASAAQIGPGYYESETYGFSVEWDESAWNASETGVPGAEGLDVEGGESFGAIYAGPSETDAANCYDEIVTAMTGASADGVRPAPKRFLRPIPGGDVQGELIVMSLSNEGEAYDMVLYLGCRALDGGDSVLNVAFATLASSYPGEQESWQEMLGTIEVADAAVSAGTPNMPEIGIGRTRMSDRNVSLETGIEGNTYTHVQHGFELSWDDAVWTAEEADVDDRGDALTLESDGGYALIMSYSYPDADADECLTEFTAEFEKGGETITNGRTAPARFERPEPGEDAAGELMILDVKGEELQLALYLECRVIPETDSLVVFHFYTNLDVYETQLPVWQEVLDSVETLPAPAARGAVASVVGAA